MSGQTLTRALRIEVRPVGRREDLLGDDGLYRQLWGAMSDVTRAANLTISALFQVRLGTVERPLSVRTRGAKKGETTPTGDRTLSYQALSGAWMPFGRPLYAPYVPAKKGTPHRRVGSSVLLGVAGLVFTRIQTDYLDVIRGKRALSTFRELPLAVEGAGVTVLPDRRIRLRLWAAEKGSKRSNTVDFAPVKLDAGSRTILSRVVSGEYNHGDAKIAWRKPEGRKGKWYLSLSWTGAVEERPSGLHAGAHLDMSGITVAYVDAEGKILPERDRISFPANLVRRWQVLQEDKRERLQSGREEYQRREGRGVTRKLRSVQDIGDRFARLSDEIALQTAAAVVECCQKRGASTISWDDLQDWAVQTAHGDADSADPRRVSREHRRWYFKQRQGLVREKLKDAAEKGGLRILLPPVAFVARDCAKCDAQYRKSGIYAAGIKPGPAHRGKRKGPEGAGSLHEGRVSWTDFRCPCGWKCNAQRNSALNLARRGHALAVTPAEAAAAPTDESE